MSPFFVWLIVMSFLTVRDAEPPSPVLPEAMPERIATGFQFTEGPVWTPDGALLFSDIPANRIYRWTPETGAVVWREPSGHSNGLAFDAQGRLLMAQHGERRLARLDGDEEVALAYQFDGKRLNSPNDIAVRSDGSVYFSDPSYGIARDQEELGMYGVYRRDPTGRLHLLVDSLYRPNGLAFSPDERVLYVADTETQRVLAYDVTPAQTLANARVFAVVTGNGGPQGTDGMKVDAAGRLYVAAADGVSIYAPDGTRLAVVPLPGHTTNVALGGPDGKWLFITAGDSVYRLRLA